MSSSCSVHDNESAGSQSVEHSLKLTSISEIINSISDRKRGKAISQHGPLRVSSSLVEESEAESEQEVTLPSAKNMAISAAIDSLIVTTRRRIDQLIKAYGHINDERLLHAKR